MTVANMYTKPLPVTPHSIDSSFIGLLGLENIGVAVGISFLSLLGAEIKVLPVLRPPYWISHFRLQRTVFTVAPLDSWPSKLLWQPLEFSITSYTTNKLLLY